MTQALFTSMTGMNAGTEQLVVVSDNVANMNTTAYKTSRVDFQDVWYQTNTTGTNSTRNSGGTNPYQVGVGVQCASITKDFSAASTNTTGRAEDLAITGDGWFTVQNADGKMMLTRDGTFSLDENGFLCTADGAKLLGMDQNVSLIGSTTPIRIPSSIKVKEDGTPADKFKKMPLTDLNSLGATNTGFRPGDFYVIVNTKDPATGNVTSEKIKVNIKENTTGLEVEDLKDDIVDNNKGADGNAKFTVEVKDGYLQFIPANTNISLGFETIDEKDGGSNFVAVTNIASMPENDDGSINNKRLNTSVDIGEVDDITSPYSKDYESFSIGKDGLMTVTYEDGSKLTIKSNEDGSTYFSYTTSGGIIVDDDINNSGKASLYVDPNVLEEANMQLQMVKVVNNAGLVAEGNNRYTIGVNCGEVIYSAANVNGIVGVVSGALESSNVDLAQQFSNMILAQRLVQTNSRVFSGANQMLETLVYLGQ